MNQSPTHEFGKLRAFFWPIHRFELKKLVPMFLLFFFISFNYTILRDTKDTLVVTASGAETILFLKFWGVVPASIIFMLMYAKLSNILSKENLFYASILPFIFFFALFPTVLYPNREWLHPHATADFLETILPVGLKGLIACFRNWTYSVFYILSELWGSVVMSLLFWGFANDTTKVGEAKRFYAMFGLGANFALLFSGPAIVFVSDIRSQLPADIDAWQVSLNWLMSMVVVAGTLVIGIYFWINRYVLTDERFFEPNKLRQAKKSKTKMSLTESFGHLMTSKYILCMAIIVLAYGIAINLVEVTWKSQLKLQYPNPNDYSTFMGYFSFMTGLVTILMLLFLGTNLLRVKGWKFTAMVTPVVLLLTGVGFFSFVIFKDSLAGFIAMLGTTPLFLAVMFGMAQNIMSKSAKYSLFDPTKEMAYIPLDQDAKVKGKAAIDVVGARLGKSGGAVIQQGLVVAFGSIAAITPYVAVILFVIIAAWLLAVQYLGKEFNRLTSQPQEEPQVAVIEEKALAAEVGTQESPASAVVPIAVS